MSRTLELSSLLPALIEIRRRAVRVLFFFFLSFALCYFFSDQLLQWVFSPLQEVLSAGETLVALSLSSAVLTPLNASFHAALFCTSPAVLYHLWAFVSPGLYQHEKNGLRGLVITAHLLFFMGVLFCFYFILPWMFKFFVYALPDGVKLMPDMASALDFILRMMMVFGFCFQLPLICVALVKMRLVSLAGLQKARPYVIVAAFTLGMILTPPDVVSQILLAVPLWFLYESGLLVISCFIHEDCAKARF